MEEEADKTDAKPAAKELPVATVAGKPPAASIRNVLTTRQQYISSNSDRNARKYIVTDITDDATPAVNAAQAPNKSKVLGVTYPNGGSNQLLYATRRERRRAERHDPVARARRQALKVWASDQKRRRSSAEESTVSEGARQQNWGGGLQEWAAIHARNSIRIRRKSSSDATVDHNRKNNSVIRCLPTKKPPLPCSFALREMSVPHHARNIVELVPGPQRSRRTAVAPAPNKQAAARRVSLNLYPWRVNMKLPEKHSKRSAFDILGERDTPTAPSTPRSPTAAASPASAIVAGRGSPWARSPSRETAGGILVKHCFFYGPSGKATSRGSAAATTSPSFESPWMRQFREEVQSNPNWWVGSDRFALNKAATVHSRNALGGGKGSSGKSAKETTSTGLTPRGKGRSVDRATDLWREVRSLLAAGGHSRGTKLPLGSTLDREHSDDEGEATPCRVDLLSFDDRLRCTPLSQGAWVVGKATAAAGAPDAAVADSSAGKLPKSSISLPEGSSSVVPAVEVVGATAAGIETKQVEKKQAFVDDCSSEQVPESGDASLHYKGGQTPDGNTTSKAWTNSSPQDLQNIHAVTLAKLRGEIDPFTREELVLRAAEEARGALARDRARSTSPRRASAGGSHSSARGRKWGSIPDSIDYDKVEATLSLIELATRAAGPDAGKQMLQALEGLDKMHQRVQDEKDSTEKDPEGRVGEDASTSVDDADGEKESSGAGEAGVEGPTTAATESLPATANEQHLSEAAEKDATNTDGLSRKLSIAVSSSSEESAGSKTSSVGMIQTIGNWLWSNNSPALSRRNSQVAEGDEEKEQESGRSAFPVTLEGSGENDLETDDLAGGIISDRNEDDQDRSSEGRARSNVDGQQSEPAEILAGPLVSATASFTLAESTSAELEHSDRPTETRTGRRVSGLQSGRDGDPARLQSVVTGITGFTSSNFLKLVKQEISLHDKPSILRARRNSEADKPTRLPHLAAETARAEEALSDGGDIDVKTVIPESEQEERDGREEATHCTLAVDHASASRPIPSFQVGSEGIPQGDPIGDNCSRRATPENDSAHILACRTEESCSSEKVGELRHPVVAKATGDTAETGGITDGATDTNSRAPALPHRDSWVSLGTRPRRGNGNIPEEEPAVAGDNGISSTTTLPAGRYEASTLLKREGAISGSEPLNTKVGITGIAGTKDSAGGRYVRIFHYVESPRARSKDNLSDAFTPPHS